MKKLELILKIFLIVLSKELSSTIWYLDARDEEIKLKIKLSEKNIELEDLQMSYDIINNNIKNGLFSQKVVDKF